jgi:hypothetical protein
MTDSGPSKEPLQELPAGIPRRYAEYKPVQGAAPPPPTNVGGYDELLAYFRSLGEELPRSKEGLAAIDHLIDGLDDRATLAELVRAIGMFYGDVLTHAVPGAHWEVIVEGRPCVRVSRTTAVSVVSVAERRLDIGTPTLQQNYAHVLEIVASQT